MDLALTIPMVIPRPFAPPVGNRGMVRMATPITRPFIRIEQRATGGHVVGDQVRAGLSVRMVTDPPALLSRVPRDNTDDRRPIVRIGAVPLTLIGAPPGRIRRVTVRRAFFPPRSGTTRQPRRPCPSSGRSGRMHSDGPEYAAVAYGAVGVTAPTHVPGGPSILPWQSRVAGVPAWRVVAASFRRQSLSTACNSHDRRDSDRPESSLAPGIGVAPYLDNAGIAGRPGGGAVRAKACRCSHPVTRQLGSQSWGDHTTSSTVATHEPYTCLNFWVHYKLGWYQRS